MTARTAAATFLLLATALAAAAQPSPLVTDASWGPLPFDVAPKVDLSQRKTLAIPELPAAPEIDGVLEDSAWEVAAETDEWMVSTGEARAPVQTRAWFGTFAGQLFVGVRAEEPNLQGIVANITEDGGSVWSDDCVEMFVDGNLDLETARQLAINSLGTVTTLVRGGDWSPEVARAARVGEDAWFAEFALPLSALGLTGTDFGLNICRERRAGGGNQLSCWSPTGGGFHEPARFGLASLPGGYLRAFTVGEGMLGQSEVTVTVENPDDRERRLSVGLTWWQGDGLALERVLGPYSIQPGQQREVTFGYDIARADAPVNLELAVTDEEGKVLARRQVTQPVVDVLDLVVSRRLFVAGDRHLAARGTLRVSDSLLQRGQVVLAVFDGEMAVKAREELQPADRALRAEMQLPELQPGAYTLHLVLKEMRGETPRRIAEEKLKLIVLPEVPLD